MHWGVCRRTTGDSRCDNTLCHPSRLLTRVRVPCVCLWQAAVQSLQAHLSGVEEERARARANEAKLLGEIDRLRGEMSGFRGEVALAREQLKHATAAGEERLGDKDKLIARLQDQVHSLQTEVSLPPLPFRTFGDVTVRGGMRRWACCDGAGKQRRLMRERGRRVRCGHTRALPPCKHSGAMQ